MDFIPLMKLGVKRAWETKTKTKIEKRFVDKKDRKNKKRNKERHRLDRLQEGKHKQTSG